MNYFPFHVGDYATHTSHLDELEDLAYRRMLDLYYLREAPLPLEPAEIARLIRMRPHIAQVATVLREFFAESADGWHQARCDEELARMQDKQTKARASAAASVNARRAKDERPSNVGSATAECSLSGRSTEAELPTPTPTPMPIPIPMPIPNTGNTPSAKRADVPCPVGVDANVWRDFLAIRKAKRSPLTATAIEGIEHEAAKAGMTLADALAMCCARGWQGFDAEWVARQRTAPAAETTYQRSMRERMQEAAPEAARKDPSRVTPAAFFSAIEVRARSVEDVK